MSVKIKIIPNILSEKGRTTLTVPFESSVKKCLKHAEKEHGLQWRGQRIILRGACVKDLTQDTRDNDEIIVTPDVKDPITAAISSFIAAAFTEYLLVTLTVISIAYSVYSVLNKPKVPSFGGIGEGADEGSPTYNFDGMVTTQEVNQPVPIVYGEHPVPGNILNAYTSYDGDKNYLNVLLGLSEGEIDSISDIRINDQPIANYTGISYETRVGTASQSVIANFEDQNNVIPVGQNLTLSSPVTYTTVDSDVEAFEIDFTMPNGVFQVSDKGAVKSWSITYKVEYKLTSSGVWIDLGNYKISNKARNSFVRKFRKTGLAAGKYDIRITRITADSSLDPVRTGDVTVTSVNEIKTDDIGYPHLALLGVKALATNQLSGSTPNFRATLKGIKHRIPSVMNGTVVVDWDDYYWDPDYGGGVGAYRLLSNDAVLSWDGVTYHTGYSANPVWCMRDLLTNDRYGLGDYIEVANIDDDLLVEESKYCEEKVSDGNGGYEKRFRLDVVLDSTTKALDTIIQLATTFRGIVFYSEGTVKLRIDRPTSVTQLFGMGNIVKSEFVQQWESRTEYHNQVFMQFLNQDLDYKFDTVPFEDESALAVEPRNSRTIRLFSTKLSYAKREARYALKVARNITRSVTLKAGIDALAVQPGDVIGISHDLPQIGFSGRCIAGSTSTTIKLDQSVTLVTGVTYEVSVQHDDDTIETKTVTTSPGTTDTLTISGSWTKTPDAYTSKYIFGEQNIQYKPFRVVGIRRINRLEVELSAVEYNSAVYDDTDIIAPQINYSVLNTQLQNVSNLSVTEMLIQLNDGSLKNTLEIWWKKPDQAGYFVNTWDRVKIYLSDDAGETWVEKGESYDEKFVIDDNIETGATYYVAVVSVSTLGAENPIDSSPQGNITTLGKQAPPSNVANFDASQRGENLRFSWDPIPDGDLARYVIKKGGDWSTGELIAEKVDVTEFEFPVGEIGPQSFMIKAIDTSGNESTQASIDTLTVTPPPEQNFVENVDLWDPGIRPYKLTNIAVVPDNLFNKAYTRDTFGLQTTETWQDIEDLGKTWDQLETDGDLVGDKVYESSGTIEQTIPYDLQSTFEFTVVVSAMTKNVTGGTLTVQISTSEDNVTYSAFANVDPNTNYRARYVKFKYLLATSDTNHNIIFYGGTIFINAASVKVDFARDVSISAGGTAITFRDDFTAEPRVTGLVIVDGTLGIPYITAKSATGMTVKIRNLGDTADITGTVDWEVKGS